jgi:STE24 endopeptidase
LVLGTGTLALLAWRPPRRVFERLGQRRPIRGAAIAGAGISLLLVAVDLPLAAWSHQRAVDVGLSTQEWPDWFVDVGKSAAIGAGFAAIGAALGLGLVRRFRRHWWAPGALVVIAFGVITIWLFPVVIDPIFNDFKKLPPGQTRSDVLELAKKAGVDVGEVYRIDASRRTTAANAYVNGLGHSKRVVLFDNLITKFPRDQIRLVVAHELGHQKHNDVLRGLAWLALVAPAGTFLTQRLAEAFGRRYGLGDPARKPGPAALPAIALAVALATFAFSAASNVLSREVEASADSFSLRLTNDPAAFVQFEQKLAVHNISDPDPPGVWQALFGTHPTTLQRIGIGKTFDATN